VFEWRENIEYAVTIALSFVVGHGLARVVRMRWQGSER
jgi:hypothetical protein